ncbi:phosphoenolpyruvate synthase regulatory protein [Anoxybacter fermentans]|uniref:Putative pyruvate, phosphate dikinase regulatory protein n=1 Tax=Anoxybacter fermentans TaxID=1323375 RepID=A0A3Q9HQB6_9FIRM|nr:pyruvate, water dikinase regulatory protein [Anoxybacter fermentans]AZR73142.1 phosphoenolpyruvate synthase regulatory protein [Anoxybacter fermentans]
MSIFKDNPQVVIIADSTGETAETVMRAGLSQFGLKEVEIKKYTQIEEPEQIIKVIERYKNSNCLIAFTIILPELKETLKEEAKKYNLPIIDLIGPVIEKISHFLGITPQLKPGAYREVDQTYYQRIEAIEHAVRCDDGRDLRTLFKSDLVIIGVSRTSKTPLCMYLAYHGIKAGNLPLVPEVVPPKELFTFNPEKIFGLIIDPEELRKIRRERLKSMRLDYLADYAQLKRIYEELNYSRQIMEKIGCQIIDVTNKSIEETASEILTKRRDF